jgi:DNA-directed RNA polymerase subunit beta
VNRYRLGRVGRFRINRKFGQNVPDDEMTLRPRTSSTRSVLIKLRAATTVAQSTTSTTSAIVACARSTSWRRRNPQGLPEAPPHGQERMSLKDVEEMTPADAHQPKSVSAAIEYFFGRGELSQVVDQTNPLSMLTHERRLSALGPGGLNRKRAGFEVRDVHISHYGRICPIETPEGTNIGLISSLAIYAGRRLRLPDHAVPQGRHNGKVTDEVVWLRADEEIEAYGGPADTRSTRRQARRRDASWPATHGDFQVVPSRKIQYMDVSAEQMVGVSAGLIPFLEHDDANRALMGSNMQRQAVPLLITEPPLVGTGMERDVAETRAWSSGPSAPARSPTSTPTHRDRRQDV